MQIWAAVNEADVGRIKPGLPVTFTVDAFSGREFQATVSKVRLNATMTQNVVLYTVEINVDNPDKLLLPYLTANVRFILRHENNALLVPNSALRWSPSSLAEVAPDARNSDLIDPPGDTNSSSPAAKAPAQKSSARTLWIKSGDFVRPIAVTAGVSDGINTSVNSDNIHEGDEIVTGEVFAAQNDVKNPFLPKVIRR
jgi:HlyD family secretion protein